MPDIKPFRGILYNREKTKLADVVAPPYDVISSHQQAELYERSPYNIVRLILGREDDPYNSAGSYFEQWKKDRIVLTDETSSMYVLTQTFGLPDGGQVTRRGFIAACRLEEFGKGSIYPHEKTHAKPKEDRFQLFKATNAMFSQIFGLYSDPKYVIDKYLRVATPPYVEVKFEGVTNRLWKLTDSLAVASISDFLKSQKILVADGHHRYETALLYRDAKRFNNPAHNGREAYNFVPMFFTNMNDPGLQILPTHRLVHSLPDFKPASFLDALSPFFHVDVQASAEKLLAKLKEKGSKAFGLVLRHEPEFLLIWLNNHSAPKMNRGREKVLNHDVELLHTVVLKNILNLSDEVQDKKLNLDYEKDTANAIQAVRSGKAQAAFLMNPTRIEQVRAVAEAGVTMPQKSTFFYPKLLSGLVIYSFIDG